MRRVQTYILMKRIFWTIDIQYVYNIRWQGTCILFIPLGNFEHIFCILSTKILDPIDTILLDGVDSSPSD